MISAAPKHAEFLSDPDFPRLKEWIISRTGLSYYDSRDADLILALEREFALTGPLPSALTLLNRLQTSSRDVDALVEQLTIGETFFFRHLEMFHALRDSVFPDLLKRKALTRTLRIWSAGCSIGAEPYSIAILLRELLGIEYQNWSIHILGTDINRRFLKLAEAAAYDPWTLRGVPPHILNRCFIKEGAKWQLTPRSRAGVSFRSHNLATDTFPDAAHDLAGFDLIICRNVMIYFDHAFIRRLARQFHDTLIPGGWLAVGHAEPHTDIFSMFRTVNTTGAVLYQKPVTEPAAGSEGSILPPVSFPGSPSTLPRVKLTASPAPTVWRPLLPDLAPGFDRQAASRTEAVEKTSPLPAAIVPIAQEPVLEVITRLADIGDLKAALKACDAAILYEPLLAGAHYYHGMILYQLGEWTGAERSIRRCLYLARDLALAHYYLGLIQERLRRSALRHFSNALELLAGQPDDHLVPLGQGLTVREFRSLLTSPEFTLDATNRA